MQGSISKHRLHLFSIQPTMTFIKVTGIFIFVVCAHCLVLSTCLRCGIKPSEEIRNGKVIGGSNAKFGEVPWYGALQTKKMFGIIRLIRCGVVIIDFNWVLTAAHCVERVKPADISILFGSQLIPKPTGHEVPVTSPSNPLDRFLQERNIAKIIIHPNFDPINLSNDIALLKLDTSLQFNFNVQPICLPSRDEDFAGHLGHISGFGAVSFRPRVVVPQVLQVALVPILTNRQCYSMFVSSGILRDVPKTELCAGYVEGGVDSCRGDSGGPLTVYSEYRQAWVLAGIVSNGIRCAEPGLPGIYTRVTSYLDWINKNIQEPLSRDFLYRLHG